MTNQTLRDDKLGISQEASEFVRLVQFEEERTITVSRFRGVCEICGWESTAVDSPHSNTAHWSTVRHIEQNHAYRLDA
jgi:hypothetical protein